MTNAVSKIVSYTCCLFIFHCALTHAMLSELNRLFYSNETSIHTLAVSQTRHSLAIRPNGHPQASRAVEDTNLEFQICHESLKNEL